MGVGPADAASLSLWEYQGMLHHHNERMDPEGKNARVEAPDVDTILDAFERAERSGFSRMPTEREIN